MSETHQRRTLVIAVMPQTEPIFSDRCTRIEIDDEAAGEFVTVRQLVNDNNPIRIDPDEWPAIRDAIEHMIDEIKRHERT